RPLGRRAARSHRVPDRLPVTAETARILAPGMSTDAETGGRTDSLETLISEAQAAVSSSANALRDVRERYRTAHMHQLEAWERLRDEVARATRGGENGRPARRKPRGATAAGGTAKGVRAGGRLPRATPAAGDGTDAPIA